MSNPAVRARLEMATAGTPLVLPPSRGLTGLPQTIVDHAPPRLEQIRDEMNTITARAERLMAERQALEELLAVAQKYAQPSRVASPTVLPRAEVLRSSGEQPAIEDPPAIELPEWPMHQTTPTGTHIPTPTAEVADRFRFRTRTLRMTMLAHLVSAFTGGTR